MADTDFTTITDGDTTAADVTDDAAVSKADQAKQTVKDYSSKYGAQATDRIRSFADTGKERAVGGLDQLSQLITDAAAQVDEKLGAQYGDYARTAAGAVNTFSEQLKAKDADELLDEAREFVRKSPGVAVGVAAALGFAVARLVQSGIDSNKA